MNREIRILAVEDVPQAAELIVHELRRAALAFRMERVDSAEPLSRALEDFRPDVVLAGYVRPSLTGTDVLSPSK